MDQESVPFWLEDGQLPHYPPLSKNHRCDVCIIGAGISGLTTAYLLSCSGKKVLVLDDGPIAGGQTMRTTGHLTNALDDRYFNLESYFGVEGAKLAASSHRAAIDFVASLVSKEKIDCEFQTVDAYLFNPPGKSRGILEKELEAATRAGVNVKMVDRAPFESFDTGPSLCFSDQAQFHPLKYVKRICDLIEAKGGVIHCDTHVKSIQGKKIFRLETNQESIVETRHVVVATNSPINHRFFPHLKQAPYRTYAIACKIPSGYVKNGLYYDTPDPYHYVRVAKDKKGDEILIVGGEDHRTGEEKHIEERYRALELWTKERFPLLQEISYRWSGQILEPVDSLAFIGRVKAGEEVYMITGDSGNGLTHGILGGILIDALILDKSHPWEKLYDPHRRTLRTLPEFIEENVNTVWQYKDWFTGGEKKKLKPSSGFVGRHGMKKCATYTDEEGKVHEMSAVCPHLGAIVHWNESEHCWECPAHGSRFNAIGEVIQGPANGNLNPICKREN